MVSPNSAVKCNRLMPMFTCVYSSNGLMGSSRTKRVPS